jgi:hypothetical protein
VLQNPHRCGRLPTIRCGIRNNRGT